MWKDFATEYLFSRTWDDGDKRDVYITRHTNHGGFVEGGGWVVCIVLGSMNPWYLSSDGKWRYKFGNNWPSAEEAYIALRKSESISKSWKERE
jgi:hypothetical protein